MTCQFSAGISIIADNKILLPRRDIFCVHIMYLLMISETSRLSMHLTFKVDEIRDINHKTIYWFTFKIEHIQIHKRLWLRKNSQSFASWDHNIGGVKYFHGSHQKSNHSRH